MTLLTLACGMVFSACSGGGGKTDPPPAGYEGEFQLARYRTILPGSTSTFIFAQVLFSSTAGEVDAGSAVTLTGPAGEIPLVRREFGGRLFYQKEQGTDIPESLVVHGAPYSLDVPGSKRRVGVTGFTLDPVLTIPAPLEITSADFTDGEIVLASGDPLTITWTAGDGDYVDFIFSISSAGIGYQTQFRTVDDGSYDLPQLGIDNLHSGEGTLTVVRIKTTDHELPDFGTGVGIGADAAACRLVRQ